MIGLHLEQYRHATRMPEAYWREALRRDPGDARCNLALGRWHLRRGELVDAERLLRASIARLVKRNPNPYDGEPYYQLGLCLRAGAPAGSRMDDAYGAFFKATWSHAWQPAGFHALAEIDALRGDWPQALDHIERALRMNAQNLRARDLWAIILRRLGRTVDASEVLRATLALDPLDWWAQHLSGAKLTCDNQVRLDLALDYAGAGQFQDALGVLADASGRPRRPAAGSPPPTCPMPRSAPRLSCIITVPGSVTASATPTGSGASWRSRRGRRSTTASPQGSRRSPSSGTRLRAIRRTRMRPSSSATCSTTGAATPRASRCGREL